MTYPSGPSGEEPRQQPFAPVDPESGAVEYPPIEYDPTPPPGYSMPPLAPPPGYVPPPAYGPPPAYSPPPSYAPPPGYPPPPGYGPPPGVYAPPPGPYSQPGYGAPYGQPGTNGMATGSLVSALIALPAYLFCFGFVLSIVGIVLGVVALTQIDKNPGQRGREMAIAGIVIGGVALVGLGALVLLV